MQSRSSKLDLSASSLAMLADEPVQKLRRCERALVTLNLCDNRLASLPDSLGVLHGLKSLLAHGNQLSSVPSTIRKLAALQALDLADNQLATLPDSIGELRQLRVLLLHNNQLHELPSTFGATMPSLQTMTLSSNKLTQLPQSVSALEGLEKLALSFNALIESALVHLGALASLKQLNLSNNSLQSLPVELFGLPSLEELDIHANEIRALPEAIMGLRALKKLDISSNRMQALPVGICSLELLESISAANNPLGNPPEAVVKRGMHAIRAHFGETRTTRGESPRIEGAPASAAHRGALSGPERQLSRKGSMRPSAETRKGRARPKAHSEALVKGSPRRSPTPKTALELWKSAKEVPRRMKAVGAFGKQKKPKKKPDRNSSRLSGAGLTDTAMAANRAIVKFRRRVSSIALLGGVTATLSRVSRVSRAGDDSTDAGAEGTRKGKGRKNAPGGGVDVAVQMKPPTASPLEA